MPIWDTTIPQREKGHGYELKRTPPDGTLTAIVTCHELRGCPTHFWNHRTVPCEKPSFEAIQAGTAVPCPACEAESPTRWHAYISAWNPSTHEHFLFETTAQAAKAFEEYQASHGTLIGCHFRAYRPKRRRNARIVIECKPADLTRLKLPAAPDIMKAMAVIWQIPGAALVEDEAARGVPLIKALSDRMAQAFENPADGNGRGHTHEVQS